MLFGSENPLLRLAEQVVQQVMQQVTQQLGQIEQMALQPMQTMVQQVTGGVWIGNGADAFVNDVTTMLSWNLNESPRVCRISTAASATLCR